MLGTRKNKGFTLVELIVVIVLLGIVGTFTFSFIGTGARIYQDTTEREQLVAESRFAVKRIASELRNALPRSIRVLTSDQNRCVEFVPIVSSSNYIQIPRPGPTASDDFIGILPIRSTELLNTYLYVYATNASFIYGNNVTRRKQVDTALLDTPSAGLITLDYADTPRAFTTESPARRFYATSEPVSWCYNQAQGQIIRFSGYGLLPTQPSFAALTVSTGNREVMATQLVNNLTDTEQYPFRVFEATLQRSNLIQIDWRFERANSGERLQVLHEVHVPNVP